MKIGVLTLVALVALSSTAMAGVIVERENVADGKNYEWGGNDHAVWTAPTSLATGHVYFMSQFDVSDVEAVVVSATLDVVAKGGAGETLGTIFDVYAIDNGNEDWGETTYTGTTKDGTNAWSSIGAALADTSAVGTLTADFAAGYETRAIQIDVTDVVQLMVNEGRTLGTFYITERNSANDYNGPVTIAVKEINWLRAGGVDDYGTQLLSVTSTPEPATMGLLLVGGLALLRRKR